MKKSYKLFYLYTVMHDKVAIYNFIFNASLKKVIKKKFD